MTLPNPRGGRRFMLFRAKAAKLPKLGARDWLVSQGVPRVYGARGVVLLALSVVCAAFGIAYVGPLAIPGVSEGLRPIASLLPLEYWGVMWFVGAFHVFASAFRVDQARALGGVTGMFFAWGYSNAVASVLAFTEGRDNKIWLGAVVYMAIAVLIMGVAALLNPARSHPEITEVPGPDPTDKMGGEHGD